MESRQRHRAGPRIIVDSPILNVELAWQLAIYIEPDPAKIRDVAYVDFDRFLGWDELESIFIGWELID